jgi:hypothetical protein
MPPSSWSTPRRSRSNQREGSTIDSVGFGCSGAASVGGWAGAGDGVTASGSVGGRRGTAAGPGRSMPPPVTGVALPGLGQCVSASALTPSPTPIPASPAIKRWRRLMRLWVTLTSANRSLELSSSCSDDKASITVSLPRLAISSFTRLRSSRENRFGKRTIMGGSNGGLRSSR